MKLTDKKYEDDSSAEEIQLLKNQVSLIADDIICFEEIPTQTPFSVNTCFDEIERLVEESGASYLLIDLINANRPDAVARKVLNQRFARLEDSIKHTAYCTGKNVLINTAIRFVMFGTGLTSYTVSTLRKDALLEIENVK